MNFIDLFDFRSKSKAKTKSKSKNTHKRTKQSPELINQSESYAAQIDRSLGGAVNGSRLNGDFMSTVIQGPIDQVIRSSLESLQLQSRTLVVSTPHGKRACQYQSDNIVGADGINPQPRIISQDGKVNTGLNKMIKEEFDDWAWRSKEFSLGADFSWREFQETLERGRVTDGEVFVRLHEDENLYVEIIDSSRVDITHQFGKTEEDTYCYMGIEYNVKTNRPVRYWIKKINPLTQTASGELEGVPADDILHYFRKLFPGQQRGLPESTAVLSTLIQYDGFTKYTLVQKKAAASSMGFITQDKDSQEQLDLDDLDKDGDEEQREVIQELEAGIIQKLPAGMDIKQFSSTQGGDDFYQFTNRLEEHIAMGFGFFMQGYRGDTSNINYSSARFGDQSQRVMFKNIQRLMQEKVLEPIFERWLQHSILSEKIDLTFTAIRPIVRATGWTFPKWDSVDPLKDINTEITKIDNGLKSRADVVIDQGSDPEQVFAQIEQEKDNYVPKYQQQLDVAKAPVEAQEKLPESQ